MAGFLLSAPKKHSLTSLKMPSLVKQTVLPHRHPDAEARAAFTKCGAFSRKSSNIILVYRHYA
jgi:hypothetical protein